MGQNECFGFGFGDFWDSVSVLVETQNLGFGRALIKMHFKKFLVILCYLEKNFYNYGCQCEDCLLYTSPSPRDGLLSRMPSSA